MGQKEARVEMVEKFIWKEGYKFHIAEQISDTLYLFYQNYILQ